MQKIIDLQKGIYLLEIKAVKNFSINHKKFNKINFPLGFYYYVGSAQKNLSSRIKRHLSKTKKKKWHIDYITSHLNNRIVKIIILNNADKKFENLLAQKLTEMNLTIPAFGFGSTDDRKSKSHLFYSQKEIDYNHFSALYHSIVCLSPVSILIEG